MAEETKKVDDSMSVVEPPSAGQVHTAMGLGEGVQMTPEIRAGIERFLTSMMDAESLSAPEDPVKCGGAISALQRENRCDPFRHSYQEQVLAYVEAAGDSSTQTAPQELGRPVDRR